MRGHSVVLHSLRHHGAVHALRECLLMSWWRRVGAPCHEGALCCTSFSTSSWGSPCSTQVFVDVMVEEGWGTMS